MTCSTARRYQYLNVITDTGERKVLRVSDATMRRITEAAHKAKNPTIWQRIVRAFKRVFASVADRVTAGLTKRR